MILCGNEPKAFLRSSQVAMKVFLLLFACWIIDCRTRLCSKQPSVGKKHFQVVLLVEEDSPRFLPFSRYPLEFSAFVERVEECGENVAEWVELLPVEVPDSVYSQGSISAILKESFQIQAVKKRHFKRIFSDN